MLLTFSSKTATAIPSAAPEPARPIKCSEPILLANRDAPTCYISKYTWNYIYVCVYMYILLH